MHEPSHAQFVAGKAGWDGEKPKPDGAMAVIPVFGVLAHRCPEWALDFGYIDTSAIGRAVRAADADPAIGSIALAFHSPGGQAMGVPEVAAMIRGASKPTIGVTDGMCASGAYWLASQCDRLIATPSARVGSIGCFVAFYDYSEHFKKAGVSVDVIKSGAEKGAGIMGTSLTDEQRKRIQAEVIAIHAQFKKAVKRVRVNASEEDMEGQVYDGREAARRGLVTGMANSIEDALASGR